MLATLLPRIFPREIPSEPLKAAIRLTRSSGAEVANATTVNPTIAGLIEKERARDADPLTIHSEP
jgi:hypothetical protein